uniref:Uncharacterized protein n=1 Tax=Arundo donax TaxID=35708 RepID=A0A0A9F0B9_ARUDO
MRHQLHTTISQASASDLANCCSQVISYSKLYVTCKSMYIIIQNHIKVNTKNTFITAAFTMTGRNKEQHSSH